MTQDQIVGEVLTNLYNRHEYLIGIVNQLLGASPPKPELVRHDEFPRLENQLYQELDIKPPEPKIIIGDCRSIIFTILRVLKGIGDFEEVRGSASPSGLYIPDARITVIDPIKSVETSISCKEEGININPVYDFERIFIKEYAQYIHHWVHNFEYDMPDSDNIPLNIYFAAHNEAVAISTMYRVAKQLPHSDDYEKFINGLNKLRLRYVSSLFQNPETKFGSTEFHHVVMGLASVMHDESESLSLEDFREWFKENPLEPGRGQIESRLDTLIDNIVRNS